MQPSETMPFSEIAREAKAYAVHCLKKRLEPTPLCDVVKVKDGVLTFKLIGMPERYEFQDPISQRTIKRALLPVEPRAEPGTVLVLDASMSLYRDILNMVLNNVPPYRSRWQRFMDGVCAWVPFLWRFHAGPPVLPEYMEVWRETRRCGTLDYPVYKSRWVA